MSFCPLPSRRLEDSLKKKQKENVDIHQTSSHATLVPTCSVQKRTRKRPRHDSQSTHESSPLHASSFSSFYRHTLVFFVWWCILNPTTLVEAFPRRRQGLQEYLSQPRFRLGRQRQQQQQQDAWSVSQQQEQRFWTHPRGGETHPPNEPDDINDPDQEILEDGERFDQQSELDIIRYESETETIVDDYYHLEESENDSILVSEHEEDIDNDENDDEEEEQDGALESLVQRKAKRKRASDIILDLVSRSGVDNEPESQQLRLWFLQRKLEFLQEAREDDPDPEVETKKKRKKKAPHVKRLLNILAPKIPALKHSPDITLRIVAARPDVDPGLAASLIATLAHVCELTAGTPQGQQNDQDPSRELWKERRLGQLVECLVCGVNVPRRMEEYEQWQQRKGRRESPVSVTGDDQKGEKDDDKNDMLNDLLTPTTISSPSNNQEEGNDVNDIEQEQPTSCREEEKQPSACYLEPQGLSIRDCCRAAWGLVVLGAHDQAISDDIQMSVTDLLRALALRVRALLLHRMTLLCQDDLWHQDLGGLSNREKDSHEPVVLSMQERLSLVAQEIAEDAATAMWAFGCVRALSGIRSTELFQTCSNLLCQNPVELRRRAQTDFLPSGNNLGSNDAVEILARTEQEEEEDIEEKGSTLADKNHHVPRKNEKYMESDSKAGEVHIQDDGTILLDLLSPNELSDILWALAAHGEREFVTPSTHGHTKLSEEVATLCDVAFDRILSWLGQDSKVLGDATFSNQLDHEQALLHSESLEFGDTSDNEILSLETNVLPSDTIIAEHATEFETDKEYNVVRNDLSVDDIQTLDGDEGSVHEIGTAVDAALLLAEERASEESGSHSQEVVSAVGTDDTNIESDTLENASPSKVDSAEQMDLIFGSSELCSLAWAVTELDDSLRPSVVRQVAKIIHLRGPTCLKGRSGNALSNLARAISRAVIEDGDVNDSSFFHTVLDWIAGEICSSLDTFEETDTMGAADALLRSFQPPALSRLIFSIAAARYYTGEMKTNQDVTRIVSVAMEAAISFHNVFESEDMASIAFAYLELVYPVLLTTERPLAEHKLGSILATIELALLKWENGQTQQQKNSIESRESSRLASFFGRSWSHAAHIFKHADEFSDGLDEHDNILVEKAALPHLRDFPIDPSTLSKLTWSSSRLSSGSKRTASDTLARVALRLFTSGNGRLLRECELFDLASIARAADTVSSSRREIVSLFARRLVRVLNESQNLFESSPAVHSAALLFSLGRLGVKYHPVQLQSESAHRRLQLIAPLPLFTKEDLENLPLDILVHLVRATGMLGILEHNTAFVKDVLYAVERRMPVLTSDVDGTVVRGLVEGLGDILESTEHLQTKLDSDPKTTDNSTEAEALVHLDTKDIRLRCESFLIDIASNILLTQVGELSSSDLRRIMHVYATIPVKSDELVDKIEAIIDTRKNQYFQESELEYDPSELMSQIAANADFVKQELSGGTGKSFSALKSLFTRKDYDSKDKETGNDVHEKDAHTTVEKNLELEQALDYIIAWGDALAARSQKRQKGDHKEDCSVLVELGRCQELIAHYRRHDFESGVRRSRLDETGRREMTKRLMSRLLP